MLSEVLPLGSGLAASRRKGVISVPLVPVLDAHCNLGDAC